MRGHMKQQNKNIKNRLAEIAEEDKTVEIDTAVDEETDTLIQKTVVKKEAATVEKEDKKQLGERWIDTFLQKSFTVRGITFEMIDILFVAVLWVFAYLIRYKLFPIQSPDYYGFLEQWMQKIEELGGFSSMGTEISNYACGYMYLMCLVQSITDDWLTGLKMISVIFDYAISIAVFLIIFHMTGKTRKSIAGMAFVLLTPTTIIDSAYWCQCDVIYSCFILYALYFILKDKSSLAMIMLGISFSFKLQTVFILPFIIILWLRRYTVKLTSLLWIPVVYVISIFPAWMFGRDFTDLLLFYFKQGSYYPWGTLEYPNVYALLDEVIPNGHYSDEVSGAGLFLALMLLGIIAYYIYTKLGERDKKLGITNISRETSGITNEIFILTALLTVAITVYTLPHMHDRYGYLIDIIAIIYAVIRPKRIPLMCAFFVVSMLTFVPYLTGVHVFSLQTVAIAMTALIAVVGRDLYKEINK